MLNKDTLTNIFRGFNDKRIMIIGDVMVDAYLWGKVDRISPEAPVPIVAVNKRENRLGGAANVALNIKAMGAEPILCSLIGDDMKGREFTELLKRENMPVEGLCISNKRITTTKFRILGNNAQMLRVDEEVSADIQADEENLLLSGIKKIIETSQIEAIIFQDYNKGVLTKKIIETSIEIANKNNIITITDPKKKNFLSYKNTTLFKPNLKELREGLKLETDFSDTSELSIATLKLHKQMNVRIILATLSERGIFISWKEDDKQFDEIYPAHRRSIADVSGAGDTVVSVATLCLAGGIELNAMAKISNLAGGIVCEEVGVVPVNKERLFNETIKLYCR